MKRGRNRRRGVRRGVLAWLGLLLMAVSLIWLQRLSRSTQSLATTRQLAPTSFSGLVVLDPGHGGNDSGAMCGNVLEKDLTLDLAKRVERLAHEQGLETMLTRDRDRFVSLASRAALANRQSDCILVSLHFNDGLKTTSNGIETYYSPQQSVRSVASWLPFLQTASSQSPNFLSQSLAGFIQDALVLRTEATNRGTKTEQFYVIANVRHPAVLVEGGFLTNQSDAARISSENYREKMAGAICEGIIHYRDATRRPQTTLATTASGG